MDAEARRPWYRLHFGTMLAVFFVWMVWVRIAFERVSDGAFAVLQWFGPTTNGNGWPLAWFAHGEPHVYRGSALAFDLAFAVVSLACAGLVVERLERSRFRFRLSTALAVLTVCAVLLGFRQWDHQFPSFYGGRSFRLHIERASLIQLYHPLHAWSWHLVLTINFALGCTVYIAICLSSHAAAQATSLVLRAAKLRKRPWWRPAVP